MTMLSKVCILTIKCVNLDRALHPDWVLRANKHLGLDGLKRICTRMSRRLRLLDIGFNEHVCDLFCRAFVGREMTGGYKLNWKLTAAEQRHVFLVLPLCITDLIQEECQALNADASRPAGAPLIQDPSQEIIFALGSSLNWYQQMRCSSLTERDIDTVTGDAVSLVKLWAELLPTRDAKLPRRSQGSSTQVAPKEKDAIEDVEDEEDDISCCNESDEAEPDLFEGDSVARTGGEGMKRRAVKPAHQYPKAHAMLHASASIRLYGQWANCSAESLERKHVDIKDAAQQTNQREHWLLQVLMRTKRESDIRVQAAEVRHAMAREPLSGNIDDLDASASQGRDGVSSRNHAASQQAASFGDKLHRSGLQMPVWNFIVKWRECMKKLSIRQEGLTIHWESLAYKKSEVLRQCPELLELPMAMAYYVQEHMMHRCSRPGWGGIPTEGRLSTAEMHTLVQCVDAPPPWAGRHLGPSLLCYNVMTIQHALIDDCIIKLRAHPFRYEASSVCHLNCVCLISDTVTGTLDA